MGWSRVVPGWPWNSIRDTRHAQSDQLHLLFYNSYAIVRPLPGQAMQISSNVHSASISTNTRRLSARQAR